MTKTKTVYSFVQLFILPRLLYFVLFQQVKLVNISSNDIVDGNPKLTLGLVWSIILHWQVRKKNNKKMRGREIFFEKKGRKPAQLILWLHSSYLVLFLFLQQVQDVLKGSMAELQQSSLDRTLLVWCQEATKVII